MSQKDRYRINRNLIAPCGMNCAVCCAYLRERNPCRGCSRVEHDSPKTRLNCRIRNCGSRRGKFCFQCDEFPCATLRTLDKRYRTKYGMSEIANLEFIRDRGINQFVRSERRRWQSARGLLCVHDREYYQG